MAIVRISDELLKAAKRHAAESGKTLAAVIEDALREMLVSSQSRSERADRVRLKTSGTGGVQPGVNLDSRAMLLDAIEGGY